jgi:hypothetical protein
MATFTKINDFTEDLGDGVHNLSSDQLVIALSNTAPGSEPSDPTADGNGVLANVTGEIAYTNLSSRNLTTTSWSTSSGTAKLILADLVLTASGGSVEDFRYVYIYNDTATSDNLIGLYDNGSTVSMSDGNTYTIDFDASGGVITVA